MPDDKKLWLKLFKTAGRVRGQLFIGDVCLGDFIEHVEHEFPVPSCTELAVVRDCEWAYNEHDHAWATKCGNIFVFTDGGPKENEMVFCCYCGGRLKVKE